MSVGPMWLNLLMIRLTPRVFLVDMLIIAMGMDMLLLTTAMDMLLSTTDLSTMGKDMNDNNFANMARMRSHRLPLKLNIKFSRKENLIQPSGEPQGQHLGEFQKRYGPIVNKLYLSRHNSMSSKNIFLSNHQ